MAMVPYPEALERVLSRIEALPRPVAVELDPPSAVGLVAAADVATPEAVPPFDNSAVDGFAVRAADVQDAPVELRVVGTIAAGVQPEMTLGPGECARIMTGAVIPRGADGVVMVEDTAPVGGDRAGADRAGADRVLIGASVAVGEHIRPAGDDLEVGQVAIRQGTVLRCAHVGLLATLGATKVGVWSRPRVGVISTGDELVGPEGELQPGQIRDSNRAMLCALCRSSGFDPVDLGLVGDDEAGIEKALLAAAADCDAVVTSGGVSMGDFDHVRSVLARIGEMEWMQVAIKPAKPLAFGTIGDTPVFGLPGNPVSSLVSFELFARPGLRVLCGHPEPERLRLRVNAGEYLQRSSDGKAHFMRVTLSGSGAEVVAMRTGGQGSHQLAASAGADALAVVPDGPGIPRGAPVEVLLLD